MDLYRYLDSMITLVILLVQLILFTQMEFP